MEMTWWGLPASLLVLGLVQLAKQIGFPGRQAGILAAVLGVLGGVGAWFYGESEAVASAINGLVVGLAASGLWSTGKHVVGGDE